MSQYSTHTHTKAKTAHIHTHTFTHKHTQTHTNTRTHRSIIAILEIFNILHHVIKTLNDNQQKQHYKHSPIPHTPSPLFVIITVVIILCEREQERS